MKKITKSGIDSNTVKFQKRIKDNLQLYYFSKDAIIHFSKFYKSQFKNYEFSNFATRFKGVSIRKNFKTNKIKHSNIIEFGKNLTENELPNLIFILNISDFEAWLTECFNSVFSSDYKILLRYLNPDKNPIPISLLEQSVSINEIWQRIIDSYISNKFYDRKEKLLKNLLSACDIKETIKFETLIGKTNENFLCRNIIIHNKNKINREYINKSGKYAKFTNEGERVDISEEYLFEQASNLLSFMQEVRKKIKPESKKIKDINP